MKMLTIKSVLKVSLGFVFASAFASQAFAEDIALAGSYGSYMKSGCGWVAGGSNYYGPTSGVPYGAWTNGVMIDLYYLNCSGVNGPAAVKVVQTNFSFVFPNTNNKYNVTQSCSMNPGVASVVGNCTDYRVYN